jgi:alpha/beta superfamily hydrolase
MENNVVMMLVRAVTNRGMAALRFNFRGVGRSGGGYEGGTGEQQDVRAALAHAASRPALDPARVALAGYSFGALMAARAADTSVPALALIAPPLGMGPDLSGTLAAYPHPLLLIAGDQDHVCPAPALQTLAASCTGPVEYRIVPGTDHFWWSGAQELEETVGEFFTRVLRAGAR